ncbi:MAG: NADH-quinone oxidoreductase subunit F, partial [Bacteroidales bacterium]|nr:NADH-quinone oxidoreductase subunit F [Bacteroidales bacterium]
MKTPSQIKIVVGLGSCGIAAGAAKTYERLEEIQKIGLYDFDLEKTSCIGMCYKEPLVEVNDGKNWTIYGDITADKADDLLSALFTGKSAHTIEAIASKDKAGTEEAFLQGQVRIALRNCGHINPESLDEAEAHGAYAAIRKIAANNLTSEVVIQTIIDSGLRGRGGGGFPTGLKWLFAAQSDETEKYIICNADEGDPGAFMDRSLLEGDPHSVLEGMLIGGYAIGASSGIIYCRAEYPLAIKRLKIAIGQAKAKGYLGQNVFGLQGFDFDISIKEGAGAFVCGEETALIASIEGRRGMPRK